MITDTYNDDNEYSLELDGNVYNQDYDEAYPGEEDMPQQETDIQFE